MTLIAEGTSFVKSHSEDYLIDTRITKDLLAEQKFQELELQERRVGEKLHAC